MDSEFPCRTKTISGTNYIVKAYNVDNKLMVSSTCFTERAANDLAERWSIKYRCEIIPSPWTEEICIECGRAG